MRDNQDSKFHSTLVGNLNGFPSDVRQPKFKIFSNHFGQFKKGIPSDVRQPKFKIFSNHLGQFKKGIPSDV